MKAWSRETAEEEMSSGGQEKRARQAPGSWKGTDSEGSLLGGYKLLLGLLASEEVSNQGLPWCLNNMGDWAGARGQSGVEGVPGYI